MSEAFMLTLTYQGKEMELKARFERWGYTHRIAVLIGEDTIVFEPDEEGNYRCLIYAQLPSAELDRELVAAVADLLAKLKI